MQKLLVLILSVCLTVPVSSVAGTVTLNPRTLKSRVLEGNSQILIGLNQVVRAKDQVNLARAQLLPSVNLGALLGTAANPSFVLSSVTVLLPFLFPSKWLDLKESRKLLEAEVLSYQLTRLNIYASAYALYVTVQEDMALREAIRAQHEDLATLAEIARKRVLAGISPPDEALQAEAREKLAAVRLSQLETLVKKEIASLRQALGLSLSDQIRIEGATVPSSSLEGSSVEAVVQKAISLAPENRQVDFMIEGAKASKWSRIFGMFTGVSLSSHWTPGAGGGTTQGGVPGSFSPFEGSANLNLGFATIPTISLSNREIDALILRKRELKFEQTRIIESVLSELAGAREQLALAIQAEARLKDAYQAELNRYKAGSTDLAHLVQSQNAVTDAAVARIDAAAELDRQRISFHRSLLSDQFADIGGCKFPADYAGLPKRPSLDEFCRRVR